MLYTELVEKFENGEPIFLSEITGYSKDYIRQEMKRLTDEGLIERVYNGVYYIPYVTILGTKGKVSTQKYIEKKYIMKFGSSIGFYSGLSLANLLGFTTQNPSFFEICSNSATTKQRKINIDGVNLIVYKPVVEITNENRRELEFLELMKIIDKYCELSEDDMKNKLFSYVHDRKIDFKIVKKYLPLYPDKVYRNIYVGGLMNELV